MGSVWECCCTPWGEESVCMEQVRQSELDRKTREIV